jgi:hypothetical protein
MADGLQIRIAADVESALRSLQQVQKQLEKTELAGQSASKGVDAAARGFNKLPQSANQANIALTNLGRVVQDSPYGFIGIANNIDPLVQSFQQLSASSKESGGFLKALGASLLGPGGLALAFSAITTSIVFAQNGLSSWIKGTKEAKTANDAYSESINNVVGQLNAERKAIEDVASGQSELTRRRESNVRLTFGENLETDLLLLKSRISATSQALTRVRVEIQKSFDEEGKLYDNYINKRENSYGNLIVNEEKFNENQKKLIGARFQLQQTENKLTEQLLTQRTDVRVLNDKIAEENRKKELENYKKFVSDTIAQAKKISDFVGNTISIRLKITPLDDEATIFKASKEYLEKFRAGLYNYTLTAPPIEIDIPTVFPGESPNLEKGVSAFGAVLSKEINDYFKSNTVIDYSLILEQLKSNAAKGQDKFSFLNFSGLTKEAQELAQTGQMIANMFTPSLEAMIDAIGRGENAFKAFGEGVKAVLVQVIQKLTATAILAGVLAALFPGGIGGSKGFGAIFGKLLGFRANGGPVSGNSPYIVGERGPELFVPSVSGSIVPNNSVGSFMSGRGGDSGRGGTTLRGQDIILAYARTQRSQLRVNG